MTGKKVKWAVLLISAVIFLNITTPAFAAGSQQKTLERQVTGELKDIGQLSVAMLDETIGVLDKGWANMDDIERAAFLRLYDPSCTGEIDQSFVTAVRENYMQIRHALQDDIPVHYEPQSKLCEGMRLYYTDLLTVHVCPYFLVEENDRRKARTFIHEHAHIALLVVDRPYFRQDSKDYAQLTPRGLQAARLPVIGPVIREVTATDTLYHPDAYAHFAMAVSGGTEVLRAYGDQGVNIVTEQYTESSQEYVESNQVSDSWS